MDTCKPHVEYEQEHAQMYKMFMETEQYAIHNDPREVFEKLKMSNDQIADMFIEVLEGPFSQFEDRAEEILADLTEKFVHHLIDVELGVD